MPTVEIFEKALRRNFEGIRSETWNAETLKKSPDANLSDLLQNESNIFVKSYGNGSISTVSVRGGAAGHTAVLWNGLPLQSPMLGLLDISLIPLAVIDKAEIQLGGNSTAWGSGAIGGTMLLESSATERRTDIELKSTIGGFGLYEQQIKGQFTLGKIKSVTRLFQRRAKNDFTWKVREDLPSKRMTNSKLNQSGILQEIYWTPKTNQHLAIRYWGQNSYKEIPPTSVQNKSLANQRDVFSRFSADWKKTGKRIVWQTRAGVFNEKIHFKDPAVRIDAPSHFWNFIGEGEGELFLRKKRRILFGASQNITVAEIENYNSPKNRNRSAVFIGFRQNFDFFKINLNARQSLVDGRFIPIVPSLGFEIAPLKYFTISGKVSRNYRLPTLNDLYWTPGGNPDLLPESGWSQEIGFSIRKKKKEKFKLECSTSAFRRKIKNWIYWSPSPNGSHWSPQNLTEVISRGVEQRLKGEINLPDWHFELVGGYDFILSENSIALILPKIAEGEQLWYVPKNIAFGKIGVQFKSFEINYRHQFTGEVSTPNSTILKNYHTGNLTGAFALFSKKRSGRFFFSINNVWDANYRVIEYRPMPGRNFQTGFQLNFFKK